MAAYRDPIEDWPVGDDELSLGQPEDENAVYYVDWVEDAIYQDGSAGKRWYYTVKWSGWKRNANTKEPIASFVSKEMPKKFWSRLKLPYEPNKKQRTSNHYVTPPDLLTEWMAIARATRNNRIKTAQAKNDGKGPKNISAAVVGSDSSSSSAASSSDESDAPLAANKPKPRPKSLSPPPKKKVSGAAGGEKGKGRASEGMGKGKKKVISSDDDSEDERPKKKKATTSSKQQPRPKPTEPLQPRKRLLSESASPPPTAKRPAPRPNTNAVSSNSLSEMTSRERAEIFQEKERGRKRKEKEEKRLATEAAAAGGGTGGEVKKVVKKQHDWGLGTRVVSGGTGDVKPNVGGSNGGFEDPYSKPSSSTNNNPLAALYSSSTSSNPKKPRTTITLLLGPPQLKPTLASLTENSSKPQQSIGLVDLTDITEPLPVSLPPPSSTSNGRSSKVRTINSLFGGANFEPEVCLEQTWNVFEATVVLRAVVEAERNGNGKGGGGGVVQFCRVEAGVKGEVAERGVRELAFRKMAWWLEESCEGGSISVAYLPQSPYAFVVLPRSSPLCVELKVPSSLRDACRPYKESLIGALMILPRPSLPVPARIHEMELDISLDRWSITLPFINSLRQNSTSVAIFAPTSSSSADLLPSISLLQDLLTAPADGSTLLHQPTKVVPVPTANAQGMEAEGRRFTPEVVLVHNSKELWTLPNLVELRRRTGTRFYGFGIGKETFVPEQKTTFFEFGIARKAQITLTPSVLLEDPALVKKDLISLLKTGSLDYQLNLHPSTVVYVNSLCESDQAPFKNDTLSALMTGCRTSIYPNSPFVVAGTEPLNPTHDPELLNRNVDLDSEVSEATTFADLLKACKEYCAKEGSLEVAGGGSVDLERAETDALGMMRSNLRNPSLVNRYRRFIVVGPTKSSSEEVEGLKLGAENMSLQDLLTELKGRYP